MGIPEHLTCILTNLYSGQETTIRTRHATVDLFKIGKGVCQACILSPCLFNSYAEYIMQNAGLDDIEVVNKIAGRKSITSDKQMTPPLWQKTRRTKEPLDEGERREWKSCLKTQHLKTEDHGNRSHHFMANRWANNRNSDRLYFLGLQNHCISAHSHGIKIHLLLGRKALTNLDWWFISHMILYMLQCHCPKSSHPLSLPQSPKDCSVHLCLFCCLAYRVIVTIFLNSTYMH